MDTTTRRLIDQTVNNEASEFHYGVVQKSVIPTFASVAPVSGVV